MTAYYNEFDPRAAAWLRELIAEGHIADGDVDERSILDVTPNDLRGYTQCHFFAGIGGWSLALRLAGWDDARPVWTGSCPCQPFSEAGARKGFADERHLWPAWHYLIEQCRPPVLFGEQVEAAIRYGWLDLVRDELEGIGYAFGAAGLPAACVGAPHIRQRLWFVAHASGARAGRDARAADRASGTLTRARHVDRQHEADWLVADCSILGLANAECCSDRREAEPADHVGPEGDGSSGGIGGRGGAPDAVADADGWHASAERQQPGGEHRLLAQGSRPGFWSAAEWLPCRDGKARPVEPGVFPLAHGVPDRVGLLRGAGNAIVPQVAAIFIQAVMEEA